MDVKPGYKQTEVGVIPEDWQLRPMLSVVRVAHGQVDPKHEPYRSMILVAPDHIESGSGRLLKKETAGDQRAISGKYAFSVNDIVYSKIRPYLRKAILSDFEGLCSADMYPLKPQVDISSGFVFAVILGYHFSKYAESVSVRSGMPKINRLELAEYVMALPPTKAEQEAIAAALSDADALIESLEQLIAKKRNIKQGAMQELLTGKKRLPGFSGEWKEVRMRDLLQLNATYGIVTAGRFIQNGIKMLRGGDIDDGHIATDLPMVAHEKSNEYSRTKLEKDDVVIALVGYPGSSAKVPDELIGSNISRAVGLLRCNEQVVPDFLVCFLNSTDGRNMVLAPSAGSAQKVVNLAALNKLQFYIPPVREQAAIATVLSDMDAELSALESKLSKARQIKQGMMQELLTGRIRLI
ncbi:restriction endonuclease subunit S [Fundidesulfovibrio terrae]|uniref:restriction endonuclease subunit S n=1 Tax=Fundidesulfovibrio terrae TaxID=2922866 RepID=UPI001FAEB8F6|nr:restriction endonuclease subunit S [Fundidesulfovibrio terrae]